MPPLSIKKQIYSEKLSDVRWQKVKNSIQIRDQFTCQKCGKKDGGPFDVHHRHYLMGRDPWDYPEQLLVLLCRGCHIEEEKFADIGANLVQTLHFYGYFNTEIKDEINKLIEQRMKSNTNG